MHNDVVTTTPDTPLADAARTMFEKKIGCLVVLEGQKIVGILTESDFVRAAAGAVSVASPCTSCAQELRCSKSRRRACGRREALTPRTFGDDMGDGMKPSEVCCETRSPAAGERRGGDRPHQAGTAHPHRLTVAGEPVEPRRGARRPRSPFWLTTKNNRCTC
jgi:hypothetical protein